MLGSLSLKASGLDNLSGLNFVSNGSPNCSLNPQSNPPLSAFSEYTRSVQELRCCTAGTRHHFPNVVDHSVGGDFAALDTLCF